MLPSEKIKQFIQSSSLVTKNEKISITTNILKLIRPKSTFNVFENLGWGEKKGWPSIPKWRINDNLPTKASNSNGETIEWNLFKLFTQKH